MIIELGCLWFLSVPQINYLHHALASANNWSAHHWQITINYFAQPHPIILLLIFFSKVDRSEYLNNLSILRVWNNINFFKPDIVGAEKASWTLFPFKQLIASLEKLSETEMLLFQPFICVRDPVQCQREDKR